MRNPLRSALRWELLPASATIMAKLQPWSKGVAHTLFEKRRLQSAAAQFRNRSRTAEQRDSVVHTQHSSGAGLVVNLGEEAHTVLTGGGDRADFEKKIQELRMFLGPALALMLLQSWASVGPVTRTRMLP
jgi:hypothetical protein